MVCVDWQFPVVAVENDMPIINPVTGLQHGQLKVVLAMGSLEQISAYQRTKAGSASAISVADRPTNYLERCLFSCSCLYVSELNFFIFLSCSHSKRNAAVCKNSIDEIHLFS